MHMFKMMQAMSLLRLRHLFVIKTNTNYYKQPMGNDGQLASWENCPEG